MPAKARFGTGGKARTALLLIDFINDLDFSEGEALAPQAVAAAKAARRLRTRMRAAGLPVIYVNDNFGRWQSRFDQVVRHCGASGGAAAQLVRLLRPAADDYFVLKPLHSGFYQTPLATLLRHLGVRRLILAGVLADSCVLFTANDAYLRGFRISVPPDCVASIDEAHARQALDYMRRNLKAEIRPADALRI